MSTFKEANDEYETGWQDISILDEEVDDWLYRLNIPAPFERREYDEVYCNKKGRRRDVVDVRKKIYGRPKGT
tara:strand:+ start:969 stop:1184 length:216 start_codon:yes stop_codon:yes gene_type:complete